jgi:hypothetical protein
MAAHTWKWVRAAIPLWRISSLRRLSVLMARSWLYWRSTYRRAGPCETVARGAATGSVSPSHVLAEEAFRNGRDAPVHQQHARHIPKHTHTHTHTRVLSLSHTHTHCVHWARRC